MGTSVRRTHLPLPRGVIRQAEAVTQLLLAARVRDVDLRVVAQERVELFLRLEVSLLVHGVDEEDDGVDLRVVVLPHPARHLVPAEIERLELDLPDRELLRAGTGGERRREASGRSVVGRRNVDASRTMRRDARKKNEKTDGDLRSRDDAARVRSRGTIARGRTRARSTTPAGRRGSIARSTRAADDGETTRADARTRRRRHVERRGEREDRPTTTDLPSDRAPGRTSEVGYCVG
eukprot:31399-Pelagococcus_subviridis.AAC.5